MKGGKILSQAADKAVVKLGAGFTINLGGYESARIDVGVEIQGEKTELPKLWEQAEQEIEAQLQKQVEMFKQHIDDKETILGFPKGPTFK